MGLTNAILTGLTGIQSNQFAVDTIGNNIANVNTTGFKSSRTLFETLFVQTISGGTAPDENQGGTNPVQVGFGSNVATTQQTFTQGTNQATGVESDLAIDGDGFFVLDSPTGSQTFTRDGSFSLNTNHVLVASDGSFLQGFPAANDGTIDTGNLTTLEIPVGTASQAVATTRAIIDGNLNAGGDVASTGTTSISTPMVVSGGGAANASTPLTSLVDTNGIPLFATSNVIHVSGVQNGSADVPEADFVVGTDGTTYGDLAAFLQTAFGIDTGAGAIGSPGVTIGDGVATPAGALVVRSNAGVANAISIADTSIRNQTTGLSPFLFTSTPATGEGATTTFTVNDSLGTTVDLRIRTALESKTDAGTLWRFNVESTQDTTAGPFVSGGTIMFDQDGQFVSATGTDISLARSNTGASNPLTFSLDFSGMTSLTKATEGSSVQMADQDGHEAGTMNGYEIDQRGIITGSFDNSQTRVLGQVAIATFANNQGLVAQSDNRFITGVNSGAPQIGAPQTGAAGRINSQQLEQANVDLTRELVGLITASTGFSAAGRAVRTADDMLQELLLLVR